MCRGSANFTPTIVLLTQSWRNNYSYALNFSSQFFSLAKLTWKTTQLSYTENGINRNVNYLGINEFKRNEDYITN